MYVPKAFEMTDKEQMHKFIKENSFATVISSRDSHLHGSHLPILYDDKDDCLIGHMAKSNDQWTHGDSEVLIIFSGPHAYISPTWYREDNTVPTWNYTAVHATGTLKAVHDPERAKSILTQSVDYYESSMEQPWSFSFDNDYILNMMKMIVCFEVSVTKWEAKWKLNQNHSVTRQSNAIQGLLATKNENSIKIAELMRQNIEQLE